jgi:tetratricopeptide (TPR) repeat protein
MKNLESIWQALEGILVQEQFEQAFSLLEQSYRKANLKERSELALWGAHLHSLYAETGAQEGLNTLVVAGQNDFLLKQQPLYMGLQAELSSYLLEDESLRPTYIAQAHQALTGSVLARYHAAAALTLLYVEEAVEIWLTLPLSSLPSHLHWRRQAWLGNAHENIGQLEEALNAFSQATELAPPNQQGSMLSEQAALCLSLERFELAGTLLDQVKILNDSYQERFLEELEPMTWVQWHYLKSQSEMGLGRLDSALAQITAADQLEKAQGEGSYGVALVFGQILMIVGQPEAALLHFNDAVESASPTDLPFALHELGVAYLDTDAVLEAREHLERVLQHLEYPFIPEVHADIAECEYRLGRLPEAQALAEQALSMGATVTANLVLGAIDMDYYHLDAALEHYGKALESAAPGSREYTLAHQMLADILAQQGFTQPERILEHAKTALENVQPNDEWHHTLQSYVIKAQMMLEGGRGRMLN